MSDTEDLRARIARTLAESEAASGARAKTTRRARLAREDMLRAGTFVAQVVAGLGWLWDKVGRPVSRLAFGILRWLWRRYRRLWAYSVYRKTADGPSFSRTRAGLFLAATGFVLAYVALPVIECVWDAAVYTLTAQRHEHVYLLGSQEIDPWTGAHVVEGCARLPCSDQDAIYFRTAGGLFNNLWSLAHGHGLFYPEYVGAAVPYSTSKCVITSYGVRARFPFRLVNTYSYLLQVTCTPT